MNQTMLKYSSGSNGFATYRTKKLYCDLSLINNKTIVNGKYQLFE